MPSCSGQALAALVGLWRLCCIPIPGASPPGASPPYPAQFFPAGPRVLLKNSSKFGLRAKAVTVLPPVMLTGERGSRRRNLYLNQFHWTRESENLVGETIWRGRNKWRVEISPARVWGTRTGRVKEGEQTLSRSFADPYSQPSPPTFHHSSLSAARRSHHRGVS